MTDKFTNGAEVKNNLQRRIPNNLRAWSPLKDVKIISYPLSMGFTLSLPSKEHCIQRREKA